MSHNKHHPEAAPNPSPAEEILPPEAVVEEQGEPDAAVDPIAALVAERDDAKDKLLRVLAEMENLRRRTAKELQDARVYSTTNFAKDMLTVADNIRRALEAAPKDIVEAADPAIKSVIDGVELTERDLLNALERHNVKKLEPLNQKFDPHYHQAIFEIPDPSVPAGTVLQVMQTGFSIGERVLRPAMVGVAKGGPKATAAAEGDAGAQDAPKA